MKELFFWLIFLGAPVLLILITGYAYSPSAREKYSKAKRLPFADTEDFSRT